MLTIDEFRTFAIWFGSRRAILIYYPPTFSPRGFHCAVATSLTSSLSFFPSPFVPVVAPLSLFLSRPKFLFFLNAANLITDRGRECRGNEQPTGTFLGGANTEQTEDKKEGRKEGPEKSPLEALGVTNYSADPAFKAIRGWVGF